MENSIYIGLSKQIALERDMQIVANNVANMGTPGFRGQNLVFSEFVSDPKGADDPLSFVYDKLQYQLSEAGSVKVTENPLDLSLEGDGFFGIEGPGGETHYTRAGNFEISNDGTLVTPAGYAVADAGGGRINIPPDATDISVDQNGFVSDQNGQLGQIMVKEFENIQRLNPVGDNLYTTTEDGVQSSGGTRVFQGQLEGSNIKPVVEINRMIKILRNFQMVQNLLQSEGERLSGAIETLSKA